MNITYHTLKSEDVTALWPLYQDLIRKLFSVNYTPATIDYFLTSLFNDDYLRRKASEKLLFGARDGDTFIGFIVGNAPSGGQTHCEWLAVDESYQGNGIGSTLLRMFETDAIARGAHCLQLETEERNLDFYKHHGYDFLGLNPHGYFGAPDYYFVKQLAKPKEENFLPKNS